MDDTPRHQCLAYSGSSSRQLPALAAMIKRRLANNFRCLYLNSPPMVAAMRSCLSAAGVDVAHETAKGSLILSSDKGHLVDGRFDVDKMMGLLEQVHDQALADGYTGLWATGDMAWELGEHCTPEQLLEYEWRLEEFFRSHPALCGICQYHADTLPREMMRQGLLTHPGVFINETVSRLNPHYVRPEAFTGHTASDPVLEEAVGRICESGK